MIQHSIPMSENERSMIEKYGFQVSMESGGHYILVDPELPKKKGRFESGNLSQLIYRALDEREQYKEAGSNVVQHPVMLKPKKEFKKGKMFEIKKMIWEDKEITAEGIAEKLKEKGLQSTLPSIIAIRLEFLGTIRLLEELGALQKEE